MVLHKKKLQDAQGGGVGSIVKGTGLIELSRKGNKPSEVSNL